MKKIGLVAFLFSSLFVFGSILAPNVNASAKEEIILVGDSGEVFEPNVVVTKLWVENITISYLSGASPSSIYYERGGFGGYLTRYAHLSSGFGTETAVYQGYIYNLNYAVPVPSAVKEPILES